MSRDVRNQFFSDLSQARGNLGVGDNPLRFIEKFGAKFVPVQFYEPDALTSHSEYYYNARLNILYKRNNLSKFNAVWHPVNII